MKVRRVGPCRVNTEALEEILRPCDDLFGIGEECRHPARMHEHDPSVGTYDAAADMIDETGHRFRGIGRIE